ncbi:MAG TPA: hypothetical protein VN958_20015 [Chitinophagaceae bacterium]|nr:hypothetical protein [Chitinophagaceae bacterium]
MQIKLLILFFYCVVCILIQNANAQNVKLSGTVYDYFNKKPLDAVTVQTSTGSKTITDSIGKFVIMVSKEDSVWFSYLSKNTQKYPVDTISDLSNFEVALYVAANWLPAVKVRNSNYTFDSLQNRLEYAKVFNFRKPGLKLSSPSPSSYVPGSVTAGLDLDELINIFRFKRNHQLLSMQERLIEEEQDKYINHRFTKYLVHKLTPLSGYELDSFMAIIKPSYELLQTMNDIELGYYIQQCYKIYQNKNRTNNNLFLKKEE